MAFQHPLGLGKFEWEIIDRCLWARTVVENGFFLTSPSRRLAALRLIEKGYVTKAEPQIMHFGRDKDWGIVVLITQANIDKYNAGLVAATSAA